MLPVLKDIIDWHYKGTRYNIKVDPEDELLYGGQDGVQLTWMDAKVGDWVVTPRRGKPVEINALWYNALRIDGRRSLDEVREKDRIDRISYARPTGYWKVLTFSSGMKNKMHFTTILMAVIRMMTSRPNQVYALSLPYPVVIRGPCKKSI